MKKIMENFEINRNKFLKRIVLILSLSTPLGASSDEIKIVKAEPGSLWYIERMVLFQVLVPVDDGAQRYLLDHNFLHEPILSPESVEISTILNDLKKIVGDGVALEEVDFIDAHIGTQDDIGI